MGVVLFDGTARTALLPLTFARPVAGLRLGSLTIAEKWARQLSTTVSYLTQDYLAPRFPLSVSDDNLLVDGSLSPTVALRSLLNDLPVGTGYFSDGQLLAARLDGDQLRHYATQGTLPPRREELPQLPLLRIDRPADLFLHNDRALREDFELLTAGRRSAPPSDTNRLIGPTDQLFLEEGVSMEGCTLNVTTGPIYVGRGATLLEGCLLRGPVAVNTGAVLKMGARVYGATTIGDRCKVGGEISNVVFQANSNKGHEGYLGNAVIGEWCNIGADTNASNLKNDYGPVKVWSYAAGARRPTGLQFHGLIMGDHSKTGINTMLNTGTVIGFSANVFGAGFPPPFLPSFSWGGGEGLTTYRLDKAVATATRVMQRRGMDFDEIDQAVFSHIYAESEVFR